MLFSKQSRQIGLYISHQTIACVLVQGDCRQFKVGCQAFCRHEDDDWQPFISEAYTLANNNSLPVYISIDTRSLYYQRLVLPSVLSRRAIKHYITRSVKQLLGVEQPLYHDYLIHKIASGYQVEIYGVTCRLYHYCQQIGHAMGRIHYMGPSEWVRRQCLQYWLPLKADKGYIIDHGDDRYYWYQKSNGEGAVCQHISTETSSIDDRDSDQHWLYINHQASDNKAPANTTKITSPKVMQPLWQDPLPSLTAVTASL